MSDFTPVTKSDPCPVCNNIDWCARMGNGDRVKCERESVAPQGWRLLKAHASGGVFVRGDENPPETRTGTWAPRPRPQAADPLKTGDADKERTPGYETVGDLVKALYASRGGSGEYRYDDASGEAIGLVLRFELPGGKKEYRQASRCPSDRRWRPQAMPEPRPLYRLPSLLKAADDAVVFVVEGEKAADAGAEAGLVTTTAAGGSGPAPGKTDWAALRGRRVVVLADHDTPGRNWAARVADHLGEVASDVRVVHLSDRWPDLPPGGDLVDVLEREADAAAVRSAIAELAAEAKPAGPPEPQPLPPSLLPVPAFDPAWLPQALRPWCADVADRMQCPLDFAAVGALLALSGALGTRLGIRPKEQDDWQVVPNLWGAAVGRPSAMKTPALSPALKMLTGLEKAAREASEMEKKAVARAEHAFKAKKSTLEKRLKDAVSGKAPSGQEEPELESDVLDELDALEKPEDPADRCVVTQDATPEALHVLCGDNPEGITLFVDELTGLLANLEKTGREDARAFMLTGWNGNAGYTMNRIGRGRVHAALVALIVAGGIQPGPLSKLVAQAGGSGAGADGLLQRFQLLTFPDLCGEWVLVDRRPDVQAFQRAQALYLRLWNGEAVKSAVGEATAAAATPTAPPHLRFTPAALSLWNEWYSAIQLRARKAEPDEVMESWLLKAGSMAASLALLLHVADLPEAGSAGEGVGEEALRPSLAMADYFEAHARRVLLSGRRLAVEGAERILKELDAGKLPDRFRAREVYNKGWSGLKTVKEATPALELLVDFGHLVEHPEPPGPKGGQPTMTYAWRRSRPRVPEKAPSEPSEPPAEGGSAGSAGGFRRADDGNEPPAAGVGEAVDL